MEAVRSLLASKKFLVFLATVLGLLASGITGAQPWPNVIAEILMAAAAWLTAYTVTDVVATKAKIEAETVAKLERIAGKTVEEVQDEDEE